MSCLIRRARGAWIEVIFAAIVAAGAFVFFVQPPSIPCLFHALTGLPCVACGGTRALKLLLEGSLGAAWLMNPLVITAAVASSLFVFYVLVLLAAGFAPLRPDFRRGPAAFLLRYGSISAVLANWIYVVAAGR